MFKDVHCVDYGTVMKNIVMMVVLIEGSFMRILLYSTNLLKVIGIRKYYQVTHVILLMGIALGIFES